MIILVVDQGIYVDNVQKFRYVVNKILYWTIIFIWQVNQQINKIKHKIVDIIYNLDRLNVKAESSFFFSNYLI
jgi:hypothetical protein